MVNFIFAIGLCLVVGTVHCQYVDDCDPAVVDECGFLMYDKLMDPSKVPVNQAELDVYCTNLKEGQSCLKDKLKKCTTIIPINIANTYIDSVGYSIDDICKPGGNELGKKLLPHTPCIKEKLSDFGCTKDFFKKIQSSPYEEKSKQLEAVCCAFLQYDRCYNDAVKSNCGKKAGRDVRTAIQGFGVFLIDRCLPYLAEPETCNARVAKSLPADAPTYKSILPSVALVFANNLEKET